MATCAGGGGNAVVAAGAGTPARRAPGTNADPPAQRAQSLLGTTTTFIT